MMRKGLCSAVLAAVFLSVLPAHANFEAGQRAWDAGRMDEARSQWQAAAGSGDRRAMRALGRMYLQGFGVLQNYVEAHKWFNLAASRGDTAAAAERDALAEKMTPEKVARAQALARAWRPDETRTSATTDSHASTEADSPTPELVEEASTPTRNLTSAGADSPDTTEAAPPAELVEEILTPTRTLPSDTGGNQAISDAPGTAAPSSAELAEETPTPAREPPPDARPTPPRTMGKGEVFRDCAHCPEMVVVTEGSYRMGSPSAQAGRWEDEGPRHRVTIPGPFAVGRHEVTFAEFDACHRDGGCSHAPGDAGWGRGARPVIHVSWKDAKEYVGWLSEKTGRPYRLLSEAEWEYAARAGTDSSYYWGEEPGKGHANCSRCGSDWDSKKTSPAGSFSPNGFGLFDMLGNVWEWVEDCGHRNYEGAPADGSAWVRRGDCRFRMLRGGSWEDAPNRVRSAFRHWEPDDTRNDVIGFRVATTLR